MELSVNYFYRNIFPSREDAEKMCRLAGAVEENPFYDVGFGDGYVRLPQAYYMAGDFRFWAGCSSGEFYFNQNTRGVFLVYSGLFWLSKNDQIILSVATEPCVLYSQDFPHFSPFPLRDFRLLLELGMFESRSRLTTRRKRSAILKSYGKFVFSQLHKFLAEKI